MSATPIDDAFDRLASSEAFVGDWDDVLARAAAPGERLASSPVGSAPPSRLSGRRRASYVLLAVGLALVVAVGAGVAVLAGRDDSHPSAAVTAHPRTPVTTNEIKARVLLALSDGSNDISYVETALPFNAREEKWIDLETGDSRSIFFDSSGNVTQEDVETYSGRTVTIDSVRFLEHLWLTTTRPEVGPPATESNVVDELRRLVSTGEWVVVGRETIDGTPTIHLRQEGQGYTSNGAAGTTTNDLWVDASTYYPVKETSIIGGPTNDVGLAITSQDELIPRTPENLANLTLVVPAGFTHKIT